MAWVVNYAPCSPQARPITTDRQFGIFLTAGQVRRHASEIEVRSELVQLLYPRARLDLLYLVLTPFGQGTY